MKLSILIPMYNAATYIGNCLNSLNNQGLSKEDFEVIIMDDGSTDNCAGIVSSYIISHENYILYREANSGADSTRNKLLKRAKGDYIYFLDADDYLAYNSLNSILNYAKKNDLDFIGFDTLETEKLNQFELNVDIDKPFNLPIINGLEFLKENRHLRHEVWWYIVKRDLLLSNEIVFPSNGNNSDVVFTLKSIVKAKKLSYYPIAIHRYLQTASSVMGDKSVYNRRKLIDSLFIMIVSYSKLINSFENESFEHKSVIIDNLKFRRDVYTFFTITKMLQLKLNFRIFKNRIQEFEKFKAYPIKHFIGKRYNTAQFKLINFIINQKIILFSIFYFRNIFFSIIDWSSLISKKN